MGNGIVQNPNSQQEIGNYYLFQTSNGTMNILKETRQQLKVGGGVYVVGWGWCGWWQWSGWDLGCMVC